MLCLLGVFLVVYALRPQLVAVQTTIPQQLGFHYHPGLTVYSEPLQYMFDAPPLVGKYKDYAIHPVASFQMQGRLLHKTTYRFDRLADISPMDMMFAWGSAADDRWGDSVWFEQRSRTGFMYWEAHTSVQLWERDTGFQWSNMHLLPTSKEVHRAMRSAEEGARIRLKGFLVNVFYDTGNWLTSTSRKDAGSVGCEIILVDNFEVLSSG